MSTTKIYDELLEQVAGELDELESKVLDALISAPAGISRSHLIHKIFDAWVAPEELANNTYDRKIRLAVKSMRKKRLPIFSSSGEAGYRLSEDPNEMEEMAREFDSRAEECTASAKHVRTFQKPLTLAIREFRQTHKIVSQERLL